MVTKELLLRTLCCKMTLILENSSRFWRPTNHLKKRIGSLKKSINMRCLRLRSLQESRHHIQEGHWVQQMEESTLNLEETTAEGMWGIWAALWRAQAFCIIRTSWTSLQTLLHSKLSIMIKISWTTPICLIQLECKMKCRKEYSKTSFLISLEVTNKWCWTSPQLKTLSLSTRWLMGQATLRRNYS